MLKVLPEETTLDSIRRVAAVGAEVCMGEIKVVAYSGYKSDQRPIQFTLQDRTYQILDVEDQWYSPSAMYFRVRADDGNIYILRHDEVQHRWTLNGYRQRQSGGRL